MNKYQTYETYVAVKNHFSSDSYDYFRFHGRVNFKPETFDRRKDARFFEKIGREYGSKEMLTGFFVSNFLENPKAYIKDLTESSARKIYNSWLGRVDTLPYYFKKDVTTLRECAVRLGKSVPDFLKMKKGGPKADIINMTMSKQVSLETYVILDDIFLLDEYYRERIEFDPLYENFSFKVKKYKPFLKLDRESFSEIFSAQI